MVPMVVTAAVNLMAGLLIGWSGIAGFLLPVFFVVYLKLPAASALALSFFDFAISGGIGSLIFYHKGRLNVRIIWVFCMGSLAGALLGVKVNLVIPFLAVKCLLYTLVLLAGLSILIREKVKGIRSFVVSGTGSFIERPPAALSLGFITGMICSLSGAGGPILVMPLLAALGMDTRAAVAAALFNSIFIAVPACIGYLIHADMQGMAGLFLICGFSHGTGIFIGSRSAHLLNPRILKRVIAVFSIIISLYMMSTLIITEVWL
jgi:uncharacterized membrane protein YfcA